MKVQSSVFQNSYINFKGHEAKKLDTILVNQRNDFGCDEIINQLETIAFQHKVHVEKVKYFTTPWIQDEMYFAPNKKIFSPNYRYAGFYADVYDLEPDCITSKMNPYRYKHVDGGNIFFVTDREGKQVILTARDKDGKYDLDGCEDILGVDKIIPLPRADYHADLFITPIGDNKVLVANDKLMLDCLGRLLEACTSFVGKNPDDKSSDAIKTLGQNVKELIDSYSKCVEDYRYKGCDEQAAKILEDNGFEVIRVPSRIYNFEKWMSANNRENPTHLLNYSNAITFKNAKDETIFIAGKSGLEKKLGFTYIISQKLGVDLEKLFIESVFPHIKPENIYFITGNVYQPISNILETRKGGLHCMCVEVPKFDI